MIRKGYECGDQCGSDHNLFAACMRLRYRLTERRGPLDGPIEISAEGKTYIVEEVSDDPSQRLDVGKMRESMNMGRRTVRHESF